MLQWWLHLHGDFDMFLFSPYAYAVRGPIGRDRRLEIGICCCTAV